MPYLWVTVCPPASFLHRASPVPFPLFQFHPVQALPSLSTLSLHCALESCNEPWAGSPMLGTRSYPRFVPKTFSRSLDSSSRAAAGQPARRSMIMRFQTPPSCVWPTSSARLSRSERVPAQGRRVASSTPARRGRVPNQPTCPLWDWRCPKALWRDGIPTGRKQFADPGGPGLRPPLQQPTGLG